MPVCFSKERKIGSENTWSTDVYGTTSAAFSPHPGCTQHQCGGRQPAQAPTHHFTVTVRSSNQVIESALVHTPTLPAVVKVSSSTSYSLVPLW